MNDETLPSGMYMMKRKRRLTVKQAQVVDDLTEWVLKELLEFKFKSDITNYFVEKVRAD
jgi:hypothetical protein